MPAASGLKCSELLQDTDDLHYELFAPSSSVMWTRKLGKKLHNIVWQQRFALSNHCMQLNTSHTMYATGNAFVVFRHNVLHTIDASLFGTHSVMNPILY